MENEHKLSQREKARIMVTFGIFIYILIGIAESLVAFWIFTAIVWTFVIVLGRHRYLYWKENRKNKKGGWQ